MKILFLNHNLIWRGTFFRCLGFARELVRQGDEVYLWTTAREIDAGGSRFSIDGVKVWQTPRWRPVSGHDGGYALVDNLARLIRASWNSWDVIHAFDHRPNVLLPWLWMRARRRIAPRDRRTLFVSDWCDWWAGGGITTARRRFAFIDRWEQKIEEGSKRISDGVTVISSALHERALRAGVEPNRLLTLPSGVAIERFPAMDRDECRKQLGLPLLAPILGFVGFSLWDMGLLAEAFSHIKKEIPEAVLLVVGGGVEEKEKEIFRQRFQTGQDVFLPGAVPFEEIPCYLGACDVQLLPLENNLANQARIPNKLFDYYASGRPVAASDVGDAAAYIREHQTGLAGGTDALSLAESAINLLRNPIFAGECGDRARIMAEKKFAFSALTSVLSSFYNGLMNAMI
ncbi:MAG: glycosyltransferase family 4 protein [Candidatus Omnitrophota bacterium]